MAARIIIHGNPDRFKHKTCILRFKCKECGCVFEVPDKECEYHSDKIHGIYFYHYKCPECHSDTSCRLFADCFDNEAPQY